MTVAELIAELQKMPQGAAVLTWAPDETVAPTSGPELRRMSPRPGTYNLSWDDDDNGTEVVVL